jgi:chorismate mutase
MQNGLTEWECGNYYLEYQEYKKEYDVLKQVIVNLQADHSTLENQLQDFLELKKYYDSVRKQEILEEIEKRTEEYKTSAETLERYQEQMRSSDNEIAVLDYN